jgi:hypothetical protein
VFGVPVAGNSARTKFRGLVRRWSAAVCGVRKPCLGGAVLDSAYRVLYDPPPDGGLDPTVCETHECFLVDPVVLAGERGVEIRLANSRWFFEDVSDARRDARRWLERVERSHASGAHAHVRHGEVFIDPRTGRPTSQLAGGAPIIDILQTGCALDHPSEC